MYSLIYYSDNYSKTSGNLWQYYREERASDANGAITDFSADDNRVSFKFKTKVAYLLQWFTKFLIKSLLVLILLLRTHGQGS